MEFYLEAFHRDIKIKKLGEQVQKESTFFQETKIVYLSTLFLNNLSPKKYFFSYMNTHFLLIRNQTHNFTEKKEQFVVIAQKNLPKK